MGKRLASAEDEEGMGGREGKLTAGCASARQSSKSMISAGLQPSRLLSNEISIGGWLQAWEGDRNEKH